MGEKHNMSVLQHFGKLSSATYAPEKNFPPYLNNLYFSNRR